MSKIVIFGAGKIADEAYWYLTQDSPHEIVAFTVDEAYLTRREVFGKPVVAFEEVLERYPPDDFKMFVAVGYQQLNKMRATKYAECKAKGYQLISYMCSRATNFGKVELGDNCFVLEHSVIQPCSRIGNDVFLWSSNHVGHHSSVGDHCYVCGHVIIGGSTNIEPFCFLGINSTIGHELTIGRESLIGAGALITKDVPPGSVYVEPETSRFRLDSSSFLRLTKMK